MCVSKQIVKSDKGSSKSQIAVGDTLFSSFKEAGNKKET